MQPHLNEDWFPEETRIPRSAGYRQASNLASAYAYTTTSEERFPRTSRGTANEFAPESYAWQIPGKPLSIQLNLEVVDRLQRELLESTYCGNEVVGVLIGRVSNTGSHSTVTVEDYHLAPDSNEGADSLLAKHKQLADIVAAWNAGIGDLRAVGLLRSQPRGWLALSDEDIETAKCLFPKSDNIFLAVRCSASTDPRAGFFFWEGDYIRAEESYREFPFDSRALGRQSNSRIHVLDAEAEIISETSPSRSSSRRNSWIAIGLTWGAALACTLTCLHALNTKRPAAETVINVTPHPAKFKVDFHGEPMEITLNRGLASDIEGENGPLSDRQKQLIRYFAQDLPNDEIASRLGITSDAVEADKQALAHKLGVTGDAGLVRYAIKSGLVEP